MNVKKLMLLTGLLLLVLVTGVNALSTDDAVGYWTYDTYDGYDDYLGITNGTNTGSTLTSDDCKLGDCVSTDGIDDHISYNITGTNYTNFSVSVWVNCSTAPASNEFIWGSNDTGTASRLFMYINTSNHAKVYYRSDDGIMYGWNEINDTSICTGVWHNFIVIYTGGSIAIYRDGALKATGGVDQARPLNFDNTFEVGAYNNGGSVAGFGNFTIDDIGVFGRALNSTDIAELWNGGAGLRLGSDVRDPVIQSVRIDPTTAFSVNDLIGYCNATDVNGGNVSYEFKWYLDDVENTTGSSGNVTEGVEYNVANMSSSNTSGGDSWILSCRAYDGTTYSSWLNSSTTSIIYMLGSGTVSDPFNISTCQNLQDMNTNLTSYYELTSNVNCSDTVNWNSGAGFDPIGDGATTQFSGSLDGRGYIVSELFINRSSEENIAIIGYLSEGAVTNITVDNADIYGNYHVGGIIGTMYLSETSYLGVTNSNLTSVYGNVGGVVGTIYSSNVSYSYSKNNYILMTNETGWNIAFSPGNVGGFAGFLAGGRLTDIYSNSDVLIIGDNNLTAGINLNSFGGLFGIGVDQAGRDSYINRTYSVGTINATDPIIQAELNGLGGCDGVSSCFWADSYYDNETYSAWLGNDYAGVGYNRSTSDMKTQSTYSGWDFSNVWWIDDGFDYPELRLFITNFAPGTPVVRISPTPTATDTEDLLGYCNSTDFDGNTVTYYYKWYKDGTENSSGSTGPFTQGVEINVANISSSITQSGENWTLSCRAYDGIVYSSWGNSSDTQILAGDPEIEFVDAMSSITLISGSDSTQYTTFNVSDADDNINVSTGIVTFIKASESDITSTSCATISSGTGWAYINCTTLFPYYTTSGVWNINVTIEDELGGTATNTTETVTVNVLDSIELNISTIDFGTSTPGASDIAGSTTGVLNKGNSDYTTVQLTGYDLVNLTNLINTSYFCGNDIADANTGCNQLSNASAVTIDGMSITHGQDASDSLYTYVDLPTGLAHAVYTSESSWVVTTS